MFEHLLETLPESARACRALYDAPSGGYRMPPRHENRPLRQDEVPRLRESCSALQYDCVEPPVADLLYSLVVNTRSRRILETGTSRGFSTCHLAAGVLFDADPATPPQVVTIDPAPAPHLFFEGSRLAETIAVVRADALALDPRELSEGEPFDFMFFDSLHTYAHLGGELARYLPELRTGGLFMLHDTMVYDGLGLAVLAMMGCRSVEALSLPTHRRHAEASRSPGVTVFRKIAAIAPGELQFPDLAGAADGEQKCLPHLAEVVRRTGALFTDPRYAARRMHRGPVRNDWSEALLDPAGPNPDLPGR